MPIGIAMIAVAPRYLPSSARSSGRFDVVGAVSATLGMGALVYGIVSSADAGLASPAEVVALGAAVVLLTVLLVNEARVRQPIMPLHLFRSPVRGGAYLARMLYLGAMIGFFFFTTQFLQGVLGYSALVAGNAALLAVGVTVTLVGMVWLSRVAVDTAYLQGVELPMVLIGAGQGLAFAPLTSAGITGVAREEAGAASGLVNTAHQVGSALGLAGLAEVR